MVSVKLEPHLNILEKETNNMLTKQRRRDDDDDDDVFDENGVMRDGKRWSVPLRMMDSMQREVAQHFGRVRDAAGASLSQPGFTRVVTASARDKLRDARNKSYDEYDADIGGQWQNNTGVGSHGFVGCQVGDLCTVRFGGGTFGAEGSAGHLRTIDGEMVCVADGFNPSASNDRATVDASPKDADAAYASYDTELANAWRAR